jgi:hypothetical protein
MAATAVTVVATAAATAVAVISRAVPDVMLSRLELPL